MIPPPTAYDLAESDDKHWSEMHKLMALGHETSIAASVACLWIRRAKAAEKALAELKEDYRRHRAKDI